MPLKNQVLPSDTGKGVLKESGPAKTLFFLTGTKESRPASRHREVSLKNQVLPKHCFFLSWCFDSLEAQGVSTLQNLAVFHSLGYFFGRVPLKNKVLPPDTVGFDGSSRDN